jgi:hypothetical protein
VPVQSFRTCTDELGDRSRINASGGRSGVADDRHGKRITGALGISWALGLSPDLVTSATVTGASLGWMDSLRCHVHGKGP